MGRNLFDFKVATSSAKFLSGRSVEPLGLESQEDADSAVKGAESTLSSTRSTSSSADSVPTAMDALSQSQSQVSRSRSQDHSSRGDRKPTMTFTTTSSITGTNTTTIVTGGHHGHGSHGHHHGHHGAGNGHVEASASSSMAHSAEQKASKKCSVCGKSFNPLRRRHYCRTCTAVVCSSCSISRKVESTFEGAITVRMCVSCKLSSIASQDDFYDRIFSAAGSTNASTASGSQPATSDGGFVTDRLSFASYGSAGTGSSQTKDDMSANPGTSNSIDGSATLEKRAASANQLPLRRKSSTTGNGASDSVSSNASSRGGNSMVPRRGSFTGSSTATSASPVEECPWCMNEACAPLHEYFEVPYPFFLELADPSAKNQYIAAKHLDNEKERLRSVRTLRSAIKSGTSASQTITQLCSMAAIATQCPMALVGLLDKHVYVPCAETGLGSQDKIDRQKSLAAHACRNSSPLVCSDLSRDVRFAANPWRRDVLQAQFYAGIPLTLSNGHTIGAIEVFDTEPRFACMDVISQLQAVVRGLLRKFEEILAKNPAPGDEFDAMTAAQKAAPVVQPTHGSMASQGMSAVRRSPQNENVEVKQRAPARPPAPSAPAPPAIPPPKKSPKPSSRSPAPSKPAGPAPSPPANPTTPQASSKPPPAPAPTPAPAAAPTPAAPTPAAPAPTGEAAGEPSQEEMEQRLMQLLSQTTSTQEQLRNQQGQMVNAISSHSKQISDLAKQLERMESTLASKLGSDPDGEGGEDATAEASPTDETKSTSA